MDQATGRRISGAAERQCRKAAAPEEREKWHIHLNTAEAAAWPEAARQYVTQVDFPCFGPFRPILQEGAASRGAVQYKQIRIEKSARKKKRKVFSQRKACQI